MASSAKLGYALGELAGCFAPERYIPSVISSCRDLKLNFSHVSILGCTPTYYGCV